MRSTANIIDAHLLAIHCRIGEKLIQHPELVSLAEQKLESRFKAGMIYRSVYLNWWAIIEMKDDMSMLVAQMCEDSEKMNKLRRHSPFTGILTAQEREAFFNDLESKP
ncbi:hypothetical protein [Aliiglaciecola litoralis]|uniref:Uncharacterized protein n=1 Tax=Aliiglaciecola litoralis TaxID=582857 RepID=A0ABP3WP94_9ALTE